MSDRLLPIEQNTDLVTSTIRINEQPVARTYSVLSIMVQKEVNRVPFARIILQDGNPASGDFPASNEELFVPGNTIEVLAGYHSEEETIFKGVIVKHGIRIRNTYSQLQLECKDLAVKMTLTRKSQYYADKKDSEVMEELIGAYAGLTADVAEPTEVTHKELVQYKATDWDFMLTRADANSRICVVDDGTITIAKPALDSTSLAVLQYGATIFEFDAEMDARNQVPGVTATSWDYASQALVEVQAAEPAWQDNGNIAATDLASALEQEDYTLYHNGQVVQEELQAWADARLFRQRIAKIRGRVRFRGLPNIKPNTVITLAGVGDRMNGNVFVSGIRHEISNGAWFSDAQFGMSPEWLAHCHEVEDAPASGLIPAISGLHIGIVTQLESDPDGEDRIMVKVPTLNNDADGIWARVAALDAGQNRGTYFRPEIDDEVILGFINDDPRDAVVLGMLNSSAKPAPITATNDNHEKGYVSRSEMKFIFNDDKISVTLETPAGNKFVLNEDETSILVQDQNGNKILLDSAGITMESAKDVIIKAPTGDVKVEGMNVQLKAQLNFKAEGSAGAEVSTSAVAVLKGSLVQIN